MSGVSGGDQVYGLWWELRHPQSRKARATATPLTYGTALVFDPVPLQPLFDSGEPISWPAFVRGYGVNTNCIAFDAVGDCVREAMEAVPLESKVRRGSRPNRPGVASLNESSEMLFNFHREVVSETGLARLVVRGGSKILRRGLRMKADFHFCVSARRARARA